MKQSTENIETSKAAVTMVLFMDCTILFFMGALGTSNLVNLKFDEKA